MTRRQKDQSRLVDILMEVGQRGMASAARSWGSGLVLVELGDNQRLSEATRKRWDEVQVWTNDVQDVGPMTTVASKLLS